MKAYNLWRCLGTYFHNARRLYMTQCVKNLNSKTSLSTKNRRRNRTSASIHWLPNTVEKGAPSDACSLEFPYQYIWDFDIGLSRQFLRLGNSLPGLLRSSHTAQAENRSLSGLHLSAAGFISEEGSSEQWVSHHQTGSRAPSRAEGKPLQKPTPVLNCSWSHRVPGFEPGQWHYCRRHNALLYTVPPPLNKKDNQSLILPPLPSKSLRAPLP
jgi:hypothetical protein